MCLGIPGRIVALDDCGQLAKVDVTGVRRTINTMLLENERLAPGDWVLIHVGFAMSKSDEREAQLTLDALQLLGQAYEDELRALAGSPADAGAQSGPGATPTGAVAPDQVA